MKTNVNQQGIWQTTPAPALTTDCAHLVAPWVALYQDTNYGGRVLCFEGAGLVNLNAYGFDNQTRSINNGARYGAFFDEIGGQGKQMDFSLYPPQQATLSTWDRRISSFRIDIDKSRRCGLFPMQLGVDPEIHDWETIITDLKQLNFPKAVGDLFGHHIYVSVNYLQDADSKKYKVYNKTADTWFSPDDPDANKHADKWGQFNGTIRYGISTEWALRSRFFPLTASLQPLVSADEWLLYDYAGCKQ